MSYLFLSCTEQINLIKNDFRIRYGSLMKIQKLVLATILGVTCSMSAQAAIQVKSGNSTVEKIQAPLLNLQAKATLLGFAKNEYELGMAYYEGKIVQRDPQKAAEWLLKSANKNYAPAKFVVGKMALIGDGIQQNIQAGSQLIQAAANKGDKQALAFINESKQLKAVDQKNHSVSKNQNMYNGMCSYQDFYIQSAGDHDYAKQQGKKVKDIEEYVKGPCKINITYSKNNRVEINANFSANNQNYDAYVVTKLNDSCDDGICGMAINSPKQHLTEYHRITSYNKKGEAIDTNEDDDRRLLKTRFKSHQSYCFEAFWAHSGTVFCMNLEGNDVYQHERAVP